MKKNRKESMIALGLTGLLYLFTAIALPMGYMTNDDHGIQNALSGFTTGTPYPYHQFINCILGYLLSFFYRMLPQIQWWYVMSILCMLTGIYYMYRNWLILCRTEDAGRIMTYLPIAFCSFFLWPYYLSRSAFTVVPVIFALGFLTSLLLPGKGRIRIRDILIPCLACLFGSLIRYETGMVLACYLSLCVFYYCVREEGWNRKMAAALVVYLVVFGASFLGCHQYDKYVASQTETDEFREFNRGRIQYMDYPRLQYGEEPEFFDSIGWDSKLAVSVGNWCFLDERVTGENLQAIAEKTKERGKELWNREPIWLVWAKQVYGSRFFLGITILMYTAIVISLMYFTRIGEPESVFVVFHIAGTIALTVYLCIQGRLPTRVYSVIMIPGIVILWFFLLKYWLHMETKSKGVGQLILLAALLYGGTACGETLYSPGRIAQAEWNKSYTKKINEYLLEHKENIYIHMLWNYSPGDKDEIYLEEKPNNAMFFGGSNWRSDIYYKKLKQFGLEELSMRTFENDNVYFMMDYQPELLVWDRYTDAFFSTLMDYGATKIDYVDQIGNLVCVYKFGFDRSLKDYTGFYQLGDYRFYYKNGIRQTGKFEVDGKEYYGKKQGEFVIYEGSYIFTEGALREEDV